jgi:peptidoglycan/LPS O-acetylase OafA/YrhL
MSSTHVAAVGPTAVRQELSQARPINQAGELRSPRIESLRAIAALGVVVGHTFIIALAYRGTANGLNHQLISGGLLAVFLFFTLSGYLLYWPFVRRAYGDGPEIDPLRYARNRALRILPLYYAVVTVLLAVDPLGAHRSDWWRFALFIENYSPRTVERLDSPMWSLAVEVQFYILLPVLAAAIAWVARGSLGRALVAVTGLGVGSFLLRLLDVILPSSTTFGPLDGPLGLPTLFFFFSTGMLIALLRADWRRRPPAWLRGALASPDLWLLASIPLWCLAALDPKREPLIAAAAFLMVGSCALAPGRGRLARVLEWRPLAAVGVASYSLYLWHVPLLVYLSGTRLAFFDTRPARDLTAPQSFELLLLYAVPVCLAVAFASYALIEAPFLRLRRRWA